MAYGVIINVQETVNICTQSSGYRALYKEQENQEYFFYFLNNMVLIDNMNVLK